MWGGLYIKVGNWKAWLRVGIVLDAAWKQMKGNSFLHSEWHSRRPRINGYCNADGRGDEKMRSAYILLDRSRSWQPAKWGTSSLSKEFPENKKKDNRRICPSDLISTYRCIYIKPGLLGINEMLMYATAMELDLQVTLRHKGTSLLMEHVLALGCWGLIRMTVYLPRCDSRVGDASASVEF